MRWFYGAVAVVLATVSVWAQVPRVLSYQGILTNRDGRILPDGDYELQIRLYDRLDATEPIYSERQRVTSKHGVVNVLIGTVEPLPERLTFDRVYYVGVSVNGSEELQPRTMLTAVPYALRAESAATAWALTGNSITSAWNGMSGSFLGTTNTQPLVFARTNITPLQPLQVLWVGNQGTFCFNPLASSGPAWRIQRGGGNKLGLHAVDLQSARSEATQVASGNYSVIGGGLDNTASGVGATVGGGGGNTASGSESTVGGGNGNTASGFIATVGGGEGNTASGARATVGGGGSNFANGFIATVGGGQGNTASGDYATVSGGYLNTASGDYSVVPGGYSNIANGAYNLVFGEYVVPSVTETHRVYFFGDGSNFNPSGFLVINRLDGDYPIHVGTPGGGNGNGAYLTAGGMWTNGSSRSFKERFVQYRPAEVLEKIRQLPVEGYFYNGTEEYHITPMAEDFYRLFGTGVHEIIETDSTGQLVRRPNPDVDKYLAASDVAGVALLGVKALDERMSTLGPQSSALEQRLEALQQENQHLQQRVEVLQQQNGRLQQQLEQVMERLALVEAQLQQGGSTAGENAWLGRAFRTRPTAQW